MLETNSFFNKTKYIFQKFSQSGSRKNKWLVLGFLVNLLLVITIAVSINSSKHSQELRGKAVTINGIDMNYYSEDLSGRFTETATFTLDSTNKLYGFFTTDHKQITRGGNLPS